MSPAPRTRITGFELALVVVVSLVVLAPGIGRYTLLDPWETHYGEVARMMLQNNDWVHTEWPGSYGGGFDENEGFRSKPVLQFWMMAAGMRTMGVGEDGGYSGAMADSARVLIGIRLPFVLAAISGLTLMWLMLARLIGRRMAWLGLLVVGTTPMFCMIARTAIPDMPMVACTVGALSLFTLAMEDGDRPILPWRTRGRFTLDARHLVLGLIGGFLLLQAGYYAWYFITSPQLAVRGKMPTPALWLPLLMAALFLPVWRDAYKVVRMPLWPAVGFALCSLVWRDGAIRWVLPIGLSAVGALLWSVRAPLRVRQPGQSLWRHVIDDILAPWDRHAPDRYVIRALAFGVLSVVRAAGNDHRPLTWNDTEEIAETFLRMKPITEMRQVYLIAAYAIIGVSVLAKGPPGLTVFAGVCAFHVILLFRWRALYEGAYELKRALFVMTAVFIPWHVAMWLKDGLAFISEYVFTHVLNRAGSGVDNSPGTFEYYTDQLGHGMWLWAALLPAAIAVAFLRARIDTREGRVRFTVALWAVVAVAVFCLVKTKFHHYILPAIPPLSLLVAFLLDDIYTRRERLHPLFAALGAGIVLLLCRDLMFEPDRWIEMFVFLYNRPWPENEPYLVDPSDGFLLLGVAGAVAILLLATRWVRLAVAVVGGVGLAICIYALQIYMPLAAPHWGMGDAITKYYEQRTIYGQHLVYFGSGQLRDDWHGHGDTWTFETKLPSTYQDGQPMTLDVRLHKPDEHKTREQQVTLVGTAIAHGAHSITIQLAPGERAKLDPLMADAEPAKIRTELAAARERLKPLEAQLAADRKAKKPVTPQLEQQLQDLRRQVDLLARGKRGKRKPFRAVDADRLIAWQLYWRGENFWSGEEILGFIPEMKTAFPNPNNIEINKYLVDRARMPFNRRYFVVANAGQLPNIKGMIPSDRGKATFEILDQTSNKFWLGAFTP